MSHPTSPSHDYEEGVSRRAGALSQHVRKLALELRENTRTTPFAAEALILSNEVCSLCDYVDHLHDSVEVLLAESDAASHSQAVLVAGQSPEERKAVEIQKEIHRFDPSAKDIIKALFMWRDSPEQRLRDGK